MCIMYNLYVVQLVDTIMQSTGIKWTKIDFFYWSLKSSNYIKLKKKYG
jgi:hypothetical protein